MPYLIFPAKTTRQIRSSLSPLSYSRDKNGLDVEIPFYWAVSDSADATFFQRYLEKRGFKEGVEFRYFPSPDSFGIFYGDYHQRPQAGHGDRRGHEPRLAGGSEPLVLLSQP